MERSPLVSVIIATHNRAELLTTRAIPSVLNQTYQNFELIIVADRCTDDTRVRVQAINDPRLKFIELTERPPLPEDLHARWRVASAAPRNKGLEIATGDWLTFLDDDDEFTPNHIEVLLQKALEGYDFVYGNILMITPTGERRIVGKYPPEHGHIGASSFICSAKYKHIKFNTDPTATWEPGDWNFIRRVIESGARVCYIDETVYIHYVPVRAWEREERTLPFTGERFLPWISGAQIHYEHLHRYAFATHFVRGKKVIDLACGEGYGSNMLAKEAEHVVGIEIDGDTVEHARTKYTRNNLEFIQGSILAVPIEGERLFDVAVCFEGIEHVAEHEKLLSEVKRLLKQDGLFIVSTPNKALFSDAPAFDNPYHVKELYLDEFESLLNRYFKYLQLWGQRVYAGSNIWSFVAAEPATYSEVVIAKGDREFYFAERESKEPMYLLAIASDAPLHADKYQLDSWLVDSSNMLLKDYEKQIAELSGLVQAKDTQIAELTSLLQTKDSQIAELTGSLHQIQQGIMMQLLKRYQRVVERLLPPGTRQRYYYELALAGIRVLLNEGWRSFWLKFRKWRLLQSQIRWSARTFKPLALHEKRGHPWAFPAEGPFCIGPSQFKSIGKARVALVVHAYHIDLFQEICSYIKNMPVRHSLLISVKSTEDKETVQKIIGGLPLVEDAQSIEYGLREGLVFQPSMPPVRAIAFFRIDYSHCAVRDEKGQYCSYSVS